MKKLSLLLIVLVVGTALFASNLSIGVDYADVTDETGSYKVIGLDVNPDFPLGNWGFGFSFPFRFKYDGSFTFYSEDWVPDFTEDDTFLDKTKKSLELYLPLFNYIRYGQKGDNLYGIIGKIDDFTIGTGVFVNHYSNKVLLPDTAILGLEIDIDGDLFGFPYVGFEAFTNNIMSFSILGGRLYQKPLAFVEVPIVSNLEIGFSFITDRNVDENGNYGATLEEDLENPKMWGVDLLIPFVNSDLISLNVYTDFVWQQKDELSKAARLGLGGKLLKVMTYQLSVTKPLDDNYSPEYFSKFYDLDPSLSYENSLEKDDYFLKGVTSFSLLGDKLVFEGQMTGNLVKYGDGFGIGDPTMLANLTLEEGVIPSIGLDLFYEKTVLDGSSLETFAKDVITFDKNSKLSAVLTFKKSVFSVKTGYQINFDELGNSTTSEILISSNIEIY